MSVQDFDIGDPEVTIADWRDAHIGDRVAFIASRPTYPTYPECHDVQASVELDRYGRCTRCHLPTYCHDY